MSVRIALPVAMLSVVALLSACDAPSGTPTASAAPGSGADNCLEAIKERAHSGSIMGSTVSVSPSGMTTVGAETSGNVNWSCIAGPDGSVVSVTDDSRRSN